MRRITTWLAVTLAVVGMATYYQLALAGDGHEQRPTAAGECSGQQAARATSTAAPADGESDKANDPCAQSEHTGKPGETKD